MLVRDMLIKATVNSAISDFASLKLALVIQHLKEEAFFTL